MAKAKDRGQTSLFESWADNGRAVEPFPFPSLSGHKVVWMDAEATGNNKRKDVPVSWGVSLEDGRDMFAAWGHEGGGNNVDREQFHRWAKAELPGKLVCNLNTGFDAELSRNDGLDFEELGCTLHDVAHSAALLNENRYGNEFSLDNLGKEYAGRGKVECPVKPENIYKAHASLIAPYAKGDSALARDVYLAQRPLIAEQSLERVDELEGRLIWPNNHMERSCMRLDLPKLAEWRTRLDEEFSSLLMEIWNATGVKMRPNTADSWGMLFDRIGLGRNKTGEYKKQTGKQGWLQPKETESYTDDFLKKVDNALVKKGLRMRRLSSLKSKYLDKYWKAKIGDLLPYHLYQLRASEEDYGTVVGRYSSANVNIQQVFKPGNQAARFCDCGCPKDMQEEFEAHAPGCLGTSYIIRELMIADDECDLFAVDGSQLQFRLFAHYSQDPDLISQYNKDPNVDFHRMVATLFSMSRQAAKHNNFAKVLGMGNEKLAGRLGKACECQAWEWWARSNRAGMDRRQAMAHIFGINENHAQNCPAREANDLASEYDRKFPAAKATMKRVSETAEKRGYIKTLLGRRRRFKAGDKFYSAFAGLLQGSESDVVKTKILTMYKERKTIGVTKLRCPVHDEVVGDILKGGDYRKRFDECCAEQELELKVPLIWNSGFGRNWKETK